MPVPIVYRKAGEASISTFDFIDIATGRGIVLFYGGDYKEGDVSSYALSTDQFYSMLGHTQVTSGNTLDLDFDVIFNKPMTIEGDAFINAPWSIRASGNNTISMAILLKKWDGTTETELIRGTAVRTQNFAVNQPFCSTFRLKIPKTKFKAGETFRVTWYSVPPATIEYMHDPQNRSIINNTDYEVETSQFAIHLPIVIDL